jgi:hypothetical protein
MENIEKFKELSKKLFNKREDVREGFVAAINGGILANELMDKPVEGKKVRGLVTTPAGCRRKAREEEM